MSTDKSEKSSPTSDSALIEECRALKKDIETKRDEFRSEYDKLNSN